MVASQEPTTEVDEYSYPLLRRRRPGRMGSWAGQGAPWRQGVCSRGPSGNLIASGLPTVLLHFFLDSFDSSCLSCFSLLAATSLRPLASVRTFRLRSPTSDGVAGASVELDGCSGEPGGEAGSAAAARRRPQAAVVEVMAGSYRWCGGCRCGGCGCGRLSLLLWLEWRVGGRWRRLTYRRLNSRSGSRRWWWRLALRLLLCRRTVP